MKLIRFRNLIGLLKGNMLSHQMIMPLLTLVMLEIQDQLYL
jgi:hypothetical protein